MRESWWVGAVVLGGFGGGYGVVLFAISCVNEISRIFGYLAGL